MQSNNYEIVPRIETTFTANVVKMLAEPTLAHHHTATKCSIAEFSVVHLEVTCDAIRIVYLFGRLDRDPYFIDTVI